MKEQILMAKKEYRYQISTCKVLPILLCMINNKLILSKLNVHRNYKPTNDHKKWNEILYLIISSYRFKEQLCFVRLVMRVVSTTVHPLDIVFFSYLIVDFKNMKWHKRRARKFRTKFMLIQEEEGEWII
jgi:hypothetical protein